MNQIARTPKQIGQMLRNRRRSLKLTQEELGAKTNLRQATISRIENGEPGTQLRTLLDLMTTLELEFVIQQRTKSSAKDIEDVF